MNQKYGYFDDKNREFVITRPDTPAPWINYLSNKNYVALASNTGGGFSFYVTPKDHRITRFRYNSLPVDRPGRYIYLRDRQSGNCWSITWQPAMGNFDFYECRHGMGYTRIMFEKYGIRSELLYFVPVKGDIEIWSVKIENRTKKRRELDVFSYVELCLGHALVDLINQPNDQHFNEVYFEKKMNTLFATKRYWVTFSGPTVKQSNQGWDKVVFFTSSLNIVRFDGGKNAFIGKYRSEANPVSVERGRCQNSSLDYGDAVGALQSRLILSPEEQKEFVVLLGIVDKKQFKQKTAKLINKFNRASLAQKESLQLKQKWDKYLDTLNVQTPDPNFNRMMNIWNRYQANTTFRNGRNASYYHGGLLFGMGMRDACQDIFSNLLSTPEEVKEKIGEIYSHQFQNGSTLHCYYPLTGGGERTNHSDTPLWLPLAVIEYLKETGDFSFLDLKVPYEDKGTASILTHLLKAIDYTLANLTRRNFAKIYNGDWNDTLDYVGRAGRGESIWVTQFLGYILKITIELLDFIGKYKKAGEYRHAYKEIKDSINKYAWDGRWYCRAFNDDGEPVGSSNNREGKIFLNVQSWAVISGVADKERAIMCMDSVRKYLSTPKGPMILYPPYTKPDPKIGLATRCVPGKKENGAVFNHAVSWAIMAETFLKRNDIAYDYYTKSLPFNPVISPDRYKTEPYVYSEYITSTTHPDFGEASHSWLTGSATWMFKNGLENMLGIKPAYDGLVIDPCFPTHWKKIFVERKFRKAIYKINITNEFKGKELKIFVNKKQIEGNKINLLKRRILDIDVIC
ncbi:glycosyl transferase family 36 [candidate division NPL-UPA2 bacterium]|nr:glycosyl transferase family 36 [candidate division NPL-UPA2 bacterium]